MSEVSFFTVGIAIVSVWLLLKITDFIWKILQWIFAFVAKIVILLMIAAVIVGPDTVLWIADTVLSFFSSLFENTTAYEDPTISSI